jgi:hypothetical protein
LWINSIITTVFQTQAPQNSHTFHPFRIGARRSMTLIPVSNISAVVERSVNSGAFL